nr:putative ribonuclease H-like domain-containing protein [Tanacetum cinerariifolium]
MLTFLSIFFSVFRCDTHFWRCYNKTRREAKGKSPVESLTGYRNLSAKFEDFYANSINEVNAVDSPVPAVGQIFTNNINTFSAASPSNAADKDITYTDDEEDVGAEADFINCETIITVSPIPTTRVHKDHLVTQIIGDLSLGTQTRSMTRVAKDQEPKRVHQALKDPSWIEAMREELLQFKMQKVWVLVDLPHGKRAIGHTQEEGIDYEDVFAPIAKIEAIRLFLAYASFMGFMVYQMDVKSAFLYGTIKEEVYVCQPLGFKDPDHPDKVYKVVKALYGLHQAPRAWYETLANYLLENGFQRGKIDQTLFIKRQKGNILLVPIYVDDIIFGSTNKDLCKVFEKLMKDKFQRISMGELTLFLGLQVKQKQDGTFISKDKYVAEILKKFGLTDGKSASTPIDTEKPLLKDPNDSDYACTSLDRKSTTGGSQFLGCRLISWQCKKQTVMATSSTKAELNVTAVNDVTRLQALVDKKKVIITEATIRDALRLDDAEGIDCLPNEEIFVGLSRMGYEKSSTKLTFYKAFFSQQWRFLIHTILQCNVDDVPAVVVAIEGAASVNVDDVPVTVDEPSITSPTLPTQPPPPSQDIRSTSQVQPTPPPSSQQQPQPLQDAYISMDLLHNLVDTCTTLTRRVENLEQDKIAQALEITKLKQRVKKLERRNKLKGRMIADMDADVDVTLKDVVDIEKEVDVDAKIKESADDVEVEPAELQEVVEVVTTAKLITEVVTAVIRDPEETATPSTIIHSEAKSKDKGKEILVEEPKPLKKQSQIKQDEA